MYLNARSRFYQAHMIEKILTFRCKGYVCFCACVSEAKNVCKSYIEKKIIIIVLSRGNIIPNTCTHMNDNQNSNVIKEHGNKCKQQSPLIFMKYACGKTIIILTARIEWRHIYNSNDSMRLLQNKRTS